MHISEGILDTPTLIATTTVGVALAAWSLRQIDEAMLVKTALLTAAFFLAGLIHVPIGPTNMHLALLGVMGILLGKRVFAAMAVALLLQALLLQFGGLTALGANLLIMSLPAFVCGWLFWRLEGRVSLWLRSFLAGALAVLLAAALAAGLLLLQGEGFWAAAGVLLVAHLPLAAIEGFVTLALVGFLVRNRSTLLRTPRAL